VEPKFLDDAPPKSTYAGLGKWVEHSANAAIVLRPTFGAVAMEMFEFCLYGYAAEQIKESFFLGSAVGTWACFAVPFFSRPLGGVVMGRVSDIYGRRLAVITTAYGVLGTTVLQGLIPMHTGAWGITSLVVLRGLQGLAFGAAATHSTYAVEVADPSVMGSSCALLCIAGSFGGLCAVGLFASLNSLLTPHQMLVWGWRIPYLVAAIPGLMSALDAGNCVETDAFIKGKAAREAKQASDDSEGTEEEEVGGFELMFGKYKWQVVLMVLGSLSGPAVSYVGKVFLVEYLANVGGIGSTMSLWLGTVNLMAGMVTIPFVAWATDCYGAGTCLLAGNLAVAGTMIPAFALTIGNPAKSLHGSLVLSIIFGILSNIAIPATIYGAELFPVEIRNLSSGLWRNVITCATGGLSPLFLSGVTMVHPLAPGVYVTSLAMISLAAVQMGFMARNQGLTVTHIRHEPY